VSGSIVSGARESNALSRHFIGELGGGEGLLNGLGKCRDVSGRDDGHACNSSETARFGRDDRDLCRHGFQELGTIQVGSSPAIVPMLRPAR
jgi:hypothetical protein